MNQNWKRSFFTIAIGQTVSLIGSSAVQFSLIWWISSETQSPLMLGLSGLVAFLPMVFLGPLAGVLSDKYDRKIICICADIFLGLSAAVFAVIMWIYDLPCESALIVLLLRGIGGTFHQPALQAIIPQLVPAEELMRANSWTQFMQSGALMIGPVIGAAMFAALPMPVILMTDLVGAIVASVLLGLVAVPRLAQAEAQEKQSFVRQFREGIQVFLDDRRLLLLLAIETLGMVFFLPLSSFYPLMTSSYFQASAWHGSIVELGYAIGMMGMAFLLGSVIRIDNKLRAAYLGLLGIGVTSALGGVLPPTMIGWVIFLVGCVVMGACGNLHSIPLVAYMQTTIPPERMGRAFSLLGMVGSLTMPIGLLVASPIAEKIGVHVWFLIAGVAVIAITLVGMICDRRRYTQQ